MLDAYFPAGESSPLMLLAPPRQAGAATAGTHTTPGAGHIAALCAAVITVAAAGAGIYGLPAAAGAVLACFLIRILGGTS